MRPLNSELLKEKIKEYFNYIKTIYLNEFSKYLQENTKQFIKESEDIFHFEEDLTFRVTNQKKIIFHLDLKSFIEENNLTDENNLKDISENGKSYISYLVENQENVYEVIKSKILKEIIYYFCQGNPDVITIGTIDSLTEYLGDKYKLPYEKWIPSKEKEVSNYLKEIVGEKILLSSVLNHEESYIKKAYNLYVEGNELEDYDSLKTSLNKTYKNYYQKIGKVYFVDSLYEYENLDYGITSRSKQIREEKQNLSMMQLKRLISLKESLLEIESHPFLFSYSEKISIKNSLIEVDKIFQAVLKDGKGHILDHIGEEFQKIIKLEKVSFPFSQKVWESTLTSVDQYKQGEYFHFLITNSMNSEIVEATYITDNDLINIKLSRNDYGFIIEPINDGIIYASSKDFLYRDYSGENNYQPNYNTVYVGENPIEIDNQEDSKLVTPNMIEKDNIKQNMIQNKILIQKNLCRTVGIFAFSDELEDSPSYNKAELLAEEYQLPIIKISPRSYFNGVEDSKVRMNIHIKLTETKKEQKSFFEKIKETKDKLFYEEPETINKTI